MLHEPYFAILSDSLTFWLCFDNCHPCLSFFVPVENGVLPFFFSSLLLLPTSHHPASEHELVNPSSFNSSSLARPPTMTQKVVVVGAGPVGSLAALYAAVRGYEVEVYELRAGKT